MTFCPYACINKDEGKSQLTTEGDQLNYIRIALSCLERTPEVIFILLLRHKTLVVCR